MKKTCINLLVVGVLQSGTGMEAAAQENTYSFHRLEYEGRTTLKMAVAGLASREEDRFYDIEGTRSTVFARITHAVRPMSDETRAALSLWKSITDEERKLDVSRDEVEVVYGKETLWMPVSRLEKIDLFRETQAGNGAYLMIRVLGRRGNAPILFIEYFTSMEEMGIERVFRDAVNCATKLKDFQESVDIIEEIGKRWSETAQWNGEKHSMALSYIRGLSYWHAGDYTLAEQYLEPAEQYIKSRPDDELSSVMIEGFREIGRVQRM